MKQRAQRTTGIGLAMASVALAFAAVVPSAAGAEAETIEIVIDSGRIQTGRHVVWAREGTVVLLARVSVPSSLVGRECVGTYVDTNNDSIHPGNDIVVRSGGDSVRFTGVEDRPGVVNNTASGPITLGSDVSIELIMGPDEIFSAEASVEVECVVTTTPTTEVPTSTQAPPTTQPSTPTPPTEPPPATTVPPSTTMVTPASVAPTTTASPPTTTSTVAASVLGIRQANPAVAQTGTPSFTG